MRKKTTCFVNGVSFKLVLSQNSSQILATGCQPVLSAFLILNAHSFLSRINNIWQLGRRSI